MVAVPIEWNDNVSLLTRSSLPPDKTIELPRSIGGCPEHGRIWLRLGRKGKGRGRPSVRAWVCTFGTAYEPLICGHTIEQEPY